MKRDVLSCQQKLNKYDLMLSAENTQSSLYYDSRRLINGKSLITTHDCTKIRYRSQEIMKEALDKIQFYSKPDIIPHNSGQDRTDLNSDDSKHMQIRLNPDFTQPNDDIRSINHRKLLNHDQVLDSNSGKNKKNINGIGSYSQKNLNRKAKLTPSNQKIMKPADKNTISLKTQDNFFIPNELECEKCVRLHHHSWARIRR